MNIAAPTDFQIVEPSAGLEDVLIAHFLSVKFEALPSTTVGIAKGLLLDTIGSMVASVGQDDIVRLGELVRHWGGAGEARVLGSQLRVPAHHAALVNGTMARALEIDEVHEKALLHSAASLVPIALAVADETGRVSGKELLTALVLGMDLSARFSLCQIVDITGNKAEIRAMSYTYQTGILIGSLVAARLLGFSAEQARNALGVAYSQCAGNQQALLEGVLTVRVQQGLSAMTGMMSARLAAIGITGAVHSLEGAAGYFAAFHKGRYRKEVITDRLGTHFEGDEASIKPYPGCKFTHTAISAALQLRSDPRFSLEGVERIVAHVNNREYYDIVCRPEDPAERRKQLAAPDGLVRAQFSLPFLVAVAFVHGSVDLLHFEERSRRDETVLRLVDRIETVMDIDRDTATFERVLPAPGILDVYIKGLDRPLQARVDFPKGHPKNRMSYQEISEKYLRMTGIVADRFSLDQRKALIARIATIEAEENAARILDDISP
jgi:2-methylcitrate dehydratase PrpD